MMHRLGSALYWAGCVIAAFLLMWAATLVVALASVIYESVRQGLIQGDWLDVVNPLRMFWQHAEPPNLTQSLLLAAASWLIGRAARRLLAKNAAAAAQESSKR